MSDELKRRLLVIGPERRDSRELLAPKRDNALIAANMLRSAFNWAATAEGYAFWNEVHRRIREIADKELN